MSAPSPLPRATATGLLWGRVDVCVLADGTPLITQRGELRALKNTEENGGPERGDLGRYSVEEKTTVTKTRVRTVTRLADGQFELPMGTPGNDAQKSAG